MDYKYISTVDGKYGLKYRARLKKLKSKNFELLIDAIRWRDYVIENGEPLDVATFDPYSDKYIRKCGRGWAVQINEKGHVIYPVTASTLGELKKLRNQYFGLVEESCSKCGKKFWSKFKDSVCNDCYESPLDRPEEEEATFKWTPTHPELVEKEARKIGLHYADIQKQRTLAMCGKIMT